jgi:hypothetical protein
MKSQINNKYLPNMGEALAAQLAVSLAISLNIKKFITEWDFQIVISTVQKPNISQDWRISSIIKLTIDFIPTDATWSSRRVNRSVNFRAHYVAHWAAVRVTTNSIPFTLLLFHLSE